MYGVLPHKKYIIIEIIGKIKKDKIHVVFVTSCLTLEVTIHKATIALITYTVIVDITTTGILFLINTPASIVEIIIKIANMASNINKPILYFLLIY